MDSSAERRKNPHVAVVGAGIGGLRCGDVLLSAGFTVTTFEARSRIGGRVHQESSLGHLVDTGPNWIHADGSQNPISRLAAKTGTVTHKFNDNAGLSIDPQGQLIAHNDAQRNHIASWEYVKSAMKYSAQNFDSIDPNQSVKAYLEAKMMENEGDSKWVAAMMRVAEHLGHYPGEDLAQLSLKCFYLEEGDQETDVFVASTYQNILCEIAKNTLNHSEVRLNTEVKHIRYTNDGIRLQSKSGDSETFDAIVLTAPLGWLKRNLQCFEPQLPSRVSKAIENLSFGRLEKCYVTFKAPWWQTSSTPENSPSDQDSGEDSAKSGTSTPESRSQYPQFASFHSPDYIPHPSHHSWAQECMCLSSLPTSLSHPTLLFYLFGDCGATMIKAIEDITPHTIAYNTALASFFGPLYSKLPNYDPSSPQCVPTGFLATQWGADPLAGFGSYTYAKVGVEDAEADLKVLSYGIPEYRIWLAGEHTAGAANFATTTGAYLSGEAAAEKVCKYFNIDFPSQHA